MITILYVHFIFSIYRYLKAETISNLASKYNIIVRNTKIDSYRQYLFQVHTI